MLFFGKYRPIPWSDTRTIGRLTRRKARIQITHDRGKVTLGRLRRFTPSDSTSGMLLLETETGPAHIGVRTDRDTLLVL